MKSDPNHRRGRSPRSLAALSAPRLFAAAAVALLAFSAGAQAQDADADAAPAPDPAGGVVLTVDGTPITENDVREILLARFGSQLQQMPPEQAAMVQQQMQQMVITDLVNKTVLLNAAKAEGYEATDEAVAEQLSEIAARLPEGVELEAYAAEAGIDLDRIRDQIRDDVKIRQLIESVTADIEKPGKEEVKAYYDQHPEEFTEEAMVEASHILVSTREIEDEVGRLAKKAEAEKIMLQLDEGEGEDYGERFAALAEAHSDCPSKEDGGNLGAFARGQMVPEFEEAAFKQEIGAVGELVETQFGYHLILVTDRSEAKTHSFEEVEEDLSENLYEMKRGEKIEGYISDLIAKATIEQPGAPAPPQGLEGLEGLQAPAAPPEAPAAPPAAEEPTAF